jgi:hypothetical protein
VRKRNINLKLEESELKKVKRYKYTTEMNSGGGINR